MEYTNKDLLIAAREELLRRKALVDKIYDYLEYDKERYSIIKKGWICLKDGFDLCPYIYDNEALFNKSHLNFLLYRKNAKDLDHNDINVFHEDGALLYFNKRTNDGITAFHKNRMLIPKEKENEFFDYLDFLINELYKPLTTICNDLHCSPGNIDIRNDKYLLTYRAGNDDVLITDDERCVDINAIYSLLNEYVREEDITEYMYDLLDKRVDKKIEFVEQKKFIHKIFVEYNINEIDDTLVLKRTKKNNNFIK